LQAPGCTIDAIDPGSGAPVIMDGTTAAAAVTAATLDALRSYRPDLSAADAQNLLVGAATPTAAGASLNASGAFQAAGLQAVVAGAPPVTALAPIEPPEAGPTRKDLAPARRKPRLPRPRARIRRVPGHPRRVTARLRDRPRGVETILRITASAGARRGAHPRVVARRRSRGRVLRARVPAGRSLRVSILYADPAHRKVASKPLVVVLGTSHRGRR
jgi:hypothetical protein